MKPSDAGFALFLGTLLIAPGLPVGISFVNLAPVALVIWFMLAPWLPVKVPLRSTITLALILFGVYGFLASSLSARPGALLHAAQWLFYAVAVGAMLPAYLLHKARQGRLEDAWAIIAWVGAVYAGGILVSLWWGPIYPHQMPPSMAKEYYGLELVRGIGFADGHNLAGGVMACLTALTMILYRGRWWLALCLLDILALGAVMSRGAILGAASAIAVVAGVRFLRFVVHERIWLPRRGQMAALAAILAWALLINLQTTYGQAMWERLFLDSDYRTEDVDTRLAYWESGVDKWAAKPLGERLLGSGHRSTKVNEEHHAYVTSHNGFVEILNDLGLVGLAALALLLAAAIWRAAAAVLAYDMPAARAALAVLVIMCVHNMTEMFWYDPVFVVLLVLSLTLSGSFLREAIASRNTSLRIASELLHPAPRTELDLRRT